MLKLALPIGIENETIKSTYLVHRPIKKLKTVYGCLQQFTTIDDHIVKVVIPIDDNVKRMQKLLQ